MIESMMILQVILMIGDSTKRVLVDLFAHASVLLDF